MNLSKAYVNSYYVLLQLMVDSLRGLSGVNARSRVDGATNHVNVNAMHQNRHMAEKIVQDLVILVNCKLV